MKTKPESTLTYKIGYAWYFEKANAYASDPRDILTLLGRKPKKFGEFLGVVKCVIPVLPYHVPYQWVVDSKAFRKRRFLRKMGFRRGRLPKEQTTLNRLAIQAREKGERFFQKST